MEETTEIYDQYYDKYEKHFDYFGNIISSITL